MAYRFAVDIGASRTMLALIKLSTPEIVAHERPSTDVLFTGWRAPGLALSGAIQRFLSDREIGLDEIVGVGVGVPGTLDRGRGIVLSCPNLSVLDGAPLGADASGELGLPVCLENNTNLIALGEHSAGLGREVKDMAAIFVGSGVGCGLILDGELYIGADGHAAEFGHTIVVPHGLACSCGSHGCLEMYCSGKALTLVAEGLFKPGELFAVGTRFSGAELVIERARAGHQKAIAALQEAFTYLGLGIINLINLLNPRLIVLGGGIISAWPEGVEIARQVMLEGARVEARRSTPHLLEPAAPGNTLDPHPRRQCAGGGSTDGCAFRHGAGLGRERTAGSGSPAKRPKATAARLRPAAIEFAAATRFPAAAGFVH